MTIDEIIAYIMHTPENTNPAILKDMLNDISSGEGGSSDFDTASFQIINASNDKSITTEPFACIIDGKINTANQIIGANDSTTYEMILYKGMQRAVVIVTSNETPTVTGDVEIYRTEKEGTKYAHLVRVEGDGTFTGEGWDYGAS